MNNLQFIAGSARFAGSLLSVFTQIDEIRRRKLSRDEILDLWARGKTAKEIAALSGGHKASQIWREIQVARYTGDHRATYRAGWSAKKEPEKPGLMAQQDRPGGHTCDK